MKKTSTLLFLSSLFLPISSIAHWEYYNRGEKEELFPISKRGGDTIHYFQNKRGIKVGVGKRLIFRPKSKECLQQIFSQYPYNYRKIDRDRFLFIIDDLQELFSTANALYESGCVLYAHPDFLLTPRKRQIDPLFNPQQWHLHNYGQFYSKPDIDLNAYEGWLYTRGEGVTVALIDDGFDVGHEDLRGAFIGGYSVIFRTLDITPDNIYEFHGTLCAGLIGARLNGIGVIGVAPQSDLYGVKLLISDGYGNPLPLYSSDIVQAFWYARHADVISCSWGTYNVADSVRDIIDELATNGRDGKGIPIIFASGNDGMPQYYWEEDESALESVIAVGAVTNLGEHPWYSNYGPALDFVAPSGSSTLAIATTDLRGYGGLAKGYYGHPDYTFATDLTGFSGTSAAAPQVAGVIALLLSRNPDLTREEIYTILRESAKKVGDIPYYDGRNDYFGYGLVDAKKALEEAIRRQVVGEVAGHSYPLKGYFLHYDEGPFDWIYVDSSLKFAGKLQGMKENGELVWKVLRFEKIVKEGGNITFMGGEDPLSESLTGKSFPIEGYFTRYGSGAFDWIYLTSRGKRSYKLEGLDYENHLLWVDLRLTGSVEGNMIQFR